jgi:preprotein translocase subunit SecG
MQVLVSLSTALRFVFWLIVVAAMTGALLLDHADGGGGGGDGGTEVEVRAAVGTR